jgi:hypothetical protein
MRINDKGTITFAELEEGKVFKLRSGNGYYLKVYPTTDKMYNAVNLTYNELTHISNRAEVKKVKAELNITE